MEAASSVLFCSVFALIGVCKALPPDICYQPFKWQDCGSPPKPVLYYYKSGSRCEVGFWRGCLPNPNMFEDEYECVHTCIFSVRAKVFDFHSFQNIEEGETTTAEPETEDDEGTASTGTGTTDDSGNSTDTGSTGNTAAVNATVDGGVDNGGVNASDPKSDPAGEDQKDENEAPKEEEPKPEE